MSTASNIAIAKKAYAAFAAADLPGAVEHVSPDIEWVVGGDSVVSGTYRGIDEVVGFWITMAGLGYTVTPIAFFGDGDTVVVLTESTAGGDVDEAADIIEFRDGKVVRFRSVGDQSRFERVWGGKPAGEQGSVDRGAV